MAFRVRCAASDRDVRFELPVLFVADVTEPGFASLTDSALAEHLANNVYKQHSVPLPEYHSTWFGPQTRSDGDVHEVHSIPSWQPAAHRVSSDAQRPGSAVPRAADTAGQR